MRIPLEDGTMSPDYTPQQLLARELERRRYRWGAQNLEQMREVHTVRYPVHGGPGWDDPLMLKKLLATYQTREYSDHRFSRER